MSNEKKMFEALREEMRSEGLAKLTAALPDVVAVQPMLAAIAFARYTAMRSAGFTEAQAFEVCQKVFL